MELQTIPEETYVFNNYIEYERLEKLLVDSDEFNEIDVGEQYSPVGLEEKWFVNNKKNAKWRLVRPEPPFSGIWSQV